ncbi:MAG: pilus assembly protein [Phycisphaerae bacterium]|nr:pilus assembly protein [Phycisphaerae bacterium]
MRKRLGKQRKPASAVVEMAVVTPLLLTMLFGIIEFGYAFTVRSSLATAAREGARLGAMPGSTEQEIRDRVEAVLIPVGVTTSAVELTRATPESPTEIVHISVPYEDVSLLGGYFGDVGFNLESTCSMRKEGLD